MRFLAGWCECRVVPVGVRVDTKKKVFFFSAFPKCVYHVCTQHWNTTDFFFFPLDADIPGQWATLYRVPSFILVPTSTSIIKNLGRWLDDHFGFYPSVNSYYLIHEKKFKSWSSFRNIFQVWTQETFNQGILTDSVPAAYFASGATIVCGSRTKKHGLRERSRDSSNGLLYFC